MRTGQTLRRPLHRHVSDRFCPTPKLTLLILLFALAVAGADPVPTKSSENGEKTIAKRFAASSQSAAPVDQETAENRGIISGFTQRIANWFFPSQGQKEVAEGEKGDSTVSAGSARASWVSPQQTTRGKKCSPCNSVPWVPIARAVGYNAPPPQHYQQTSHYDSAGQYSLQVPTINLKAIPLSGQYGLPPKPDYGPPKQEYGPPKQEYGPPNQDYGSPKPDYGPPNPSQPEYDSPPPKPAYRPQNQPEIKPPAHEYGTPEHLFTPPKQEQPPSSNYGPSAEQPKPEYGQPSNVDILQSVEIGLPHNDYGPPAQPPKQEYGPPPSAQPSNSYGPPSSPGPSGPSNDFVPPKPDPSPSYGPPQEAPKPEYGPPKSEHEPPKQEYGPPKQEYGPPKPEHDPPISEFGPPKSEYGPPKSEYGPPKTEYGPPKPEYGPPKPQFGPPPSLTPPKPSYGPPKPHVVPPRPQYGPPQTHAEYGPPKQNYGPPTMNYGPPKNYLQPQKGYRTPSRPWTYGPPKPQYGPPPGPKVRGPTFPIKPAPLLPPPTGSQTPQITSAGSSSHDSISYQQYLSPPPLRPFDQYHSMRIQAIPIADLSSIHVAPVISDTHFSAPAVILDAPQHHPNSFMSLPSQDILCNKCPPTGPDLSSGPSGHHANPNSNLGSHLTDEAKNAIGNFGNLPLSDSAYESSNQQDVRIPSSTENSPKAPSVNKSSHEISITKSLPISEYLSSIEYPMQIVQAPILDVPELPKYFDLGYHNFQQNNHRQQHLQTIPDSDRSPSINRPLYAYNIFHQQNSPVVRVPAPQQTAHFTVSSSPTAPSAPTAPSPMGPPRQFFNTRPTQSTTTNEVTPKTNDSQPSPTNWVTTSTSWGTPPRPFDPPSTSTEANKKTKQIHQIIVPYTTLRRPLQARKVPSEPTSMPDLQAIYVNRGVTAPAETTISNVNYALTATGSEHHDIQVPNQDVLLSSLPPEVLNKLLEIGINPEKDPKSSLQHILAAADLKALLQGEEDSVDLIRLQKNIDKWTAEGYGKRVTIPQTNSKKIPDEYFTTPAPTEEAPHETHTPPTDHEAAASQHFHVSYKVSHDKHKSHQNNDDKHLMDEVSGWSLTETEVKQASQDEQATTTMRPWEELQVSISPLTNEKVYVVTPQSVEPSAPDNSSSNGVSPTTEAVQRITRQLMTSTSSSQIVDVTTQKVAVVTPEPEADPDNDIFSNDLAPEEKASVTYLGSASSLSGKRIDFHRLTS